MITDAALEVNHARNVSLSTMIPNWVPGDLLELSLTFLCPYLTPSRETHPVHALASAAVHPSFGPGDGRVARITAGLVESNGSLLPGL